MDACHFMVGRPWKFYREIVQKKYSFKKDGVTYRIQSIVEEDKVKKITSNTLLLSGKDFLKDLKEGGGVGYDIVVKT